MTYLEFCQTVLFLCHIYDASVTSWIRSTSRNAQVGGVKTSRHLHGTAVDLIFTSTDQKIRCIKSAKLLDLFVLDEGDHLHIGVKR